MSRLHVRTSGGLKKAQGNIYDLLETHTAYVVHEGHACPNQEQFHQIWEGHPSIFIIKIRPELLYEVNIALAVYYKHDMGRFLNADTRCPACNSNTF